MGERLRGLAITVAIAGGSVAAVFVALRFALGSSFSEFFQPVGQAIWGKDGFTESLGKFISPIFTPRPSQGEKAAESRTNEFERAIAEGKSAKDAFALVGIGTEVPEGRAGLEAIATASLQQAVINKQINDRRAAEGLPPQPFKNNWIRANFEDFLAARNKTVASFGVAGSREQVKALNEFVRTLNLTEIRTILGPDALQAAIAARALTLEPAT